MNPLYDDNFKQLMQASMDVFMTHLLSSLAKIKLTEEAYTTYLAFLTKMFVEDLSEFHNTAVGVAEKAREMLQANPKDRLEFQELTEEETRELLSRLHTIHTN